MPYNFPNAPVLDEEFVAGSTSYVWDGEVWRLKPEQPSQEYLPLNGGTMLGPIYLPASPPTQAEEATHKQYVDESISAQSLYQGVWQPASNVPDLTPAVANPLNSYSWIAVTVDPLGTETPPAGIPGLSGVAIGSSDTVIYNANASAYEVVRSPAAASGFVPITGGAMTGDLAMNAASIKMGDLAGIHWGATSAQTDVLNFSEGICLYGFGGTSQFGFNITSGTLNATVQNTANQIAFNVGSEQVMNVKSDGVRIPGGNLNVSGGVTATGKFTGSTITDGANGYFIGDNWHGLCFNGTNTTQLIEYHGNFEFVKRSSGTTGGTVQASIKNGTLNVTGGINSFFMADGQVAQFRGKAEAGGASVDISMRDTGGSQNWIEISHSAVDYGGSGNDEAQVTFTMQQGGYGWSSALGINTGQVHCPRNCSADSFTDRCTAATKSDLRDVEAAEVKAAFDALRPRRFRKNNVDPVDYDGNPLPPLPQQKMRYGFVADEVYANGATKDLAVTTLHDELIGCDINQVLALTVAKVKQLEAEVARLSKQPA